MVARSLQTSVAPRTGDGGPRCRGKAKEKPLDFDELDRTRHGRRRRGICARLSRRREWFENCNARNKQGTTRCKVRLVWTLGTHSDVLRRQTSCVLPMWQMERHSEGLWRNKESTGKVNKQRNVKHRNVEQVHQGQRTGHVSRHVSEYEDEAYSEGKTTCHSPFFFGGNSLYASHRDFVHATHSGVFQWSRCRKHANVSKAIHLQELVRDVGRKGREITSVGRTHKWSEENQGRHVHEGTKCENSRNTTTWDKY